MRSRRARPASSRPIAQATGTVATPASAESRRSATAPRAEHARVAHAIRYHSGGVFSVCETACSVATRLGCRTCTGVKASSYQKLCRSSVEKRSAAASSVRAASGHHAGSSAAALAAAAAGAAAAGGGAHRGQPLADRAEAAVARGAHVENESRRQVLAAVRGAPAVATGPQITRQSCVLPSARPARCCRRRRRAVVWALRSCSVVRLW